MKETINQLEIADIFRQYSSEYIKSGNPPSHILKVINAIVKCRTKALGGHIEQCNQCGYQRISYNSCRNRHCPKCNNYAREKWLIKRKQEILNIAYYHVVFTIPALLHSITLFNSKLVYTILFKAVSETLIDLAKDSKHLGARIGIITVLHTWGQNLYIHPHIHCVVTGGGLSENGKRWITPKKSKRGKKFFIHVNILSDLFKKKFLYYLKDAYIKEQLQLKGEISYLANKADFAILMSQLYKKRWVTYCKIPFAGSEQIFNYLARYTHKIAITNNRIKRLENDRVYFSYRDYRDQNKIKETSLAPLHFIHRYLLHVLPEQFFKIRYYGLFNNRSKKNYLLRCRELLDDLKEMILFENPNWRDWIIKITGIDPYLCPKCKKGLFCIVETLMPET